MPTSFPAGSSGSKSCTERDSVLKNLRPIPNGVKLRNQVPKRKGKLRIAAHDFFLCLFSSLFAVPDRLAFQGNGVQRFFGAGKGHRVAAAIPRTRPIGPWLSFLRPENRTSRKCRADAGQDP